MNKPIRTISIFLMLLFAGLLINATYLQYYAAGKYNVVLTSHIGSLAKEARQIGEAFRENIPVIMNLTDMSDEDAKRLVDYAAGLIFGLRGTIEKVTNKVFLLSPSTVAVSAEDKRRIVEGGFYSQS